MKTILFLAHRLPFPPDRGDKIRSYNLLRYLSTRARVHLIAFADDPADRDPAAEFRALLASCTIVPRRKARARAAFEALLSRRAASIAAFADPAMAQAVDETLAAQQIDAIYVFSGQMAQYLPADGPPAVMDFVDVDSAKFAGYAADAHGTIGWMLRREARLLGAYERSIAERVSASLFVSEAEAALFRAGGGGGRIVTIENGIDTHVFDPAASFELVDQSHPLIVFTGQMDYRPNGEAVVWFAGKVLPHIRARHPDATFAIVGRAPSVPVCALAGEGVVVTGEVSDVRGWLAAATVCVAPLKLARGIQNKVLEAMAMARPVVASAAAAEGIDHADTIRVADDARDYAAAVCALIDDRTAAEALGAAARVRVRERYGWDARLAPLAPLLGLAT